MAVSNGYSFRMRQIPKPEFKLLKAMVQKYHLKDDCELITIALSLMYEVSTYKNGQGEQWIANVMSSIQSLPDSRRLYTIA